MGVYNPYGEIGALRAIGNDAERGYRFEQFIREILPWDHRPPVSQTAPSEQLDAFFQWGQWHFLVEAKGKRNRILRGGHDWEDFELKVRRRKRGVKGLFCALNSVADEVIQAAREMNYDGYVVTVVRGSDWDALAQDPLPFSGILRFLVSQVRLKFEPHLPALDVVQTWLYDRKEARNHLRTETLRASATFLDRNRLPDHDALYVARTLDNDVVGLLKGLRPSGLTLAKKERLRGNRQKSLTEISAYRRPPPQFFVVRDVSGAGKTTLAVHLGLSEEIIAVVAAADQENCDGLIDVLTHPDEETSFQFLRKTDEPLVIVIDSLDEAASQGRKRKELVALFRRIDALNAKARKDRGMVAFPIGVVATVRDEYWESWKAAFDGRGAVHFVRRLASFSPAELDEAIEKYEQTYFYSIRRPLTKEVRDLLALPFDLQVFSEASIYLGNIEHDHVLSSTVLGRFFERKKEDINKRGIPGLHGHNMMCLVAELATEVLHRDVHDLPRSRVLEITATFPIFRGSEKQVVVALQSERILTTDAQSGANLRFRHARFVEHLVAFRFLTCAEHYEDGLRRNDPAALAKLERLMAEAVSSSIVSVIRVHEAVRYLAHAEFSTIEDLIDDYYTQPTTYNENDLTRARAEIAMGDTTDPHEIALILRTIGAKPSEIAWDGFWILSAKRNAQPPSLLLESFGLAWAAAREEPARWKLITRIAERGLLMEEVVVRAISTSRAPKEWEVFLGSILEAGLGEALRDEWAELAIDAEFPGISEMEEPGWDQVRYLLNTILGHAPYLPGEVSR